MDGELKHRRFELDDGTLVEGHMTDNVRIRGVDKSQLAALAGMLAVNERTSRERASKPKKPTKAEKKAAKRARTKERVG
jgi:hypothetical protein